ncbi:DUF3450 domain-containing protein [Methylotuvimicrobium alcaliphilum]|uniref:DUF3450 domain-containing protein n=1 Tax=Methylotuvimicrobium alcaliphilum (strain DSM 19304 / NCIMB 14124 / VKM B-2133 / 20Z) TaxID=1091494 RepID=G4T199_META2|nr:DUF3450 domain-containing protein [Methylotuvimicrobium alcaliphilum]CCE25648.1 conserved protein of unknown function [Methylotuvimicrobium alcaliphilum 20Z]
MPFVDAAEPVEKEAQASAQTKISPSGEPEDKAVLLDVLSRFESELREQLKNALAELKQRIEQGPPFQLEERQKRIARLEILLNDPDADLPEQYRRVVEAYRVELDYAKTIDAYRALLKTDGNERLVDFLSIGRLALYYQTLNGRESGIWLNDSRRWQRLSGEGNEAITQGLRTARKLEPPQLIELPLPGPRKP